MKSLVATFLTLLVFNNSLQAQNIDTEKTFSINIEKIALSKEEKEWTIEGKLDASFEKIEDRTYYYEVHTFQAEAGETIVIDLISDEFDTYLMLFDEQENKIAENDDGGESYNAKIVVTLAETGTYFILATTLEAGQLGRYKLTQRQATQKDILLAKADRLNDRVVELYKQGKSAEAIPLAQEVLEIRKSIYGNQDRPAVALSLNNLARLYYAQGRITEAEPLYQEALAMRKRLFTGDHPNIATSLNNLAGLYYAQGRLTEAELLYQDALAMRKRLFTGDHPNIATSLNNLAGLYYAQGRLTEAEPLYQDALAMTKRLFTGDHPNIATSLNNLAVLYLEQGRLTEAEPLYQEALAMRKRLFTGDHPDVAGSLNNLAALYESQGRITEAEPLFQQALAIMKRLFTTDHFAVAISLNNLAALYKSQGRITEAEPLYQEALAMRKRLFTGDHPDVALSLNNLAALYKSQGKLTEAEPLYQEALAMRKRLFTRDHPSVAMSLNNLAALYSSQGRLTEAEPLYQDALAMRKRLFTGDYPDVAISLNNLAVLSWQQKRIPQTIDYFIQALDMEENILLQNLIGSESTKQSYFDTFSATTNTTISLHQQFAPNNLDATNLALTTIFRRKGRLLDSGSQTFNFIRQNLTPENQKLLDNLSAIRTQISNLSTKRTSVFINEEKLSVEDYNKEARELNQNLERLETEAEKLETQLARVSEQFRAETEKVTIEAVQEQIPVNTALIEIILYRPLNPQTDEYEEPRYVAYILDSEGKIQSVDLGEAKVIDEKAKQLVTLIKELENQYFRANVEKRQQNLQQLEQVSHQLDRMLMQPIRDLLAKNTKHLLIAPDSQLNLIPFEVLKDENNQYLVENYALSYLTSGRDLLRFQIEAEPKSNAVVVANPDYNNASSISVEPIVASNSQKNDNPNRSVDLFNLKWCCSPLKYTQEEAETIVPLLDSPTFLIQSEATEEAIKNIKAPKILHIATHGYFLPDKERETPQLNRGLNEKIIVNESDNPLLRSGLALAGFNPRDNKFEGNLTALEVAGLNLYGTKLVVLSACDTGAGDVKNGDGVYGLRRSLVLAGSESQIISLWKVDDGRTKDLMVSYYQKLKEGKGRHEALRETQLEFLKSEDYAHPYYWAAFIPSGNWRNLDGE